MGVSPEPQPKSPISIKHGALVRKRLTRRIKSNPQVSTSRQLIPPIPNSRAGTRVKSCIIKKHRLERRVARSAELCGAPSCTRLEASLRASPLDHP